MSQRGAEYAVQHLAVWVPGKGGGLADRFVKVIRANAGPVNFEKGHPKAIPAAHEGDGTIVIASFNYTGDFVPTASDYEQGIGAAFEGIFEGTLITVSKDGVRTETLSGHR